MVAEGRGFLIAYVLIMLPALAVLTLAARARRNEGRLSSERSPTLSSAAGSRQPISPSQAACRREGPLAGRPSCTAAPLPNS